MVEKVSRFDAVIAVELESIAVEPVGAGFGHDVDDVAAAPAILGSKRVGLNLELLHGVNGGNIDDATPIDTRVIGSVQQVSSGVEESAAEIQEGDILIGASGNSRGPNNLVFRGVTDRRVQGRQTDDASKVQWKFHHLPGGNIRRNIGVFRVQKGRLRSDL